MAVEVHRQPQVVPEALTELVRQIAAGVQSGLTEGHDRNHVRGADPRVDALMPAQVDLLDGPGDRSKQPLDQPGSRTGDRNHDPVVVGVRVGVKDKRLARRRADRIDYVAAPAFRKVGHRLE